MDEQKLIRRRNKAQKENNECNLVNACTDLANLYVEEGRYDFAIEEFTKVADIHKKQNKKLDFAIVNRGIGEAHLGLRNFNKALEHQKLYLEIAKELNNSLELQRAYATIGHIYLTNYLDAPEPEKNNLNQAYKFFMKSLKICENLSGEISKLEVADMSARLFSNLGLVQDCLGNFEKASELINKSINLCKTHDLYEQLHRGYVSLASLLVKKGDNKSALQQYNLGVETAKKLRNKPVLLGTVLLSKSEVLIKLGDFHAAKSTLLKAYKLKIPNVKERKSIENNLRIVAAMCKYLNKLLTTEDTDYRNLKILNEKMGDCHCELKCYSKALDYYNKMLEYANKAEMEGSELASCYYSLAETYKDNSQFKEAVVFFEMELELCRTLKDRLNTLSKIADTKEIANCTVSEIEAVYKRAIQYCQNEGDVHEEGRMLKRFTVYLRRQNKHSEAFQCEQALTKLNYNSSDSESESSEVQAGSVIGDDIDLDEITDVSDDSDVEASTQRKPRRRTKNYLIKRNNKGETQLHTACISRKLNVVHHLLEQGHPVNVRDNSGWLPLHEACNHGYIEIVQLLIEKGAAINDRGGSECEGITPLHDAASNGHLEVVQFLLSKGANAVAKTDSSETVLHCLKRWRSSRQLNSETEALYQTIAEQLTQALDKAGNSNDDVPIEVMSPSSVDREDAQVTPCKRNSRRSTDGSRRSLNMEDQRRSKTIGLEDESRLDHRDNIAEDYRNVMENLRHKPERKSPKKATTINKRSALVAADETIDDWLEDDMGKASKKRKTNSPSKSEKPHTSRRPSSHQSFDDLTTSDHDLRNIQTLVDYDQESNYYDTYDAPSTSRGVFDNKRHQSPSPCKSNASFSMKKRRKQTKLTNFGHTRTVVEADSTSSPSTSRKSSSDSTNNKFLLTQSRSFDNMQPQPVMDPTLSVDVRINERLYRVPVLLSQVNTHTIKWLADEAAARYARKEYMIPTLELETKNGAILAEDDLISLLFPMGSCQAEEVEARIMKWNVPPLIDRYKEACQDMCTEFDGTLCKLLQEFSVVLDLSNKSLKGPNLAPLCKVLNRQSNLLELHLSGNFLNTECIQFLGTSIASLHNLYKLNLNCTGLLSEHLQILIKNLSAYDSYKLADLDLSDNLLGDQSFESLALLTQRFNLKKLNLSGNKFTKDFFNYSSSTKLTLTLDEMEDFDISDNGFDNKAIIKILSRLKACNIKKLDVSRNSISHGFLRELLTAWSELDDVKLQTLKLSRCYVHDSDLFDLLRMSNSLETLDLSYNNELTSISLRRLLQCEPLVNLDLYGCNNIFKYFTELPKYLEQHTQEKKAKSIKLSIDSSKNYEESEYLVNMWKGLYGNRAILKQSSRLLCLSVLKQ